MASPGNQHFANCIGCFRCQYRITSENASQAALTW